MTINFDRDKVGISAKEDWHDSKTLANIGLDLNGESAYSIKPLPEHDSGRSSLKSKTDHFLNTMATVLFEFSDAAAILGSGQESAIANFDSTEQRNIQRFSRLQHQPEMI